MKNIFLFYLMFSVISVSAQYKYMDKDISQAQFEKLYSAYGKYIYAFEGKYYDLSDDDSIDLKPLEKSDCGTVIVKINNINKEKKEVQAERCTATGSARIDNSNKRCFIINADCEKLKDKIPFPVLKLDKSKYNYPSLTNATALFTQIYVADKDAFKTFLDEGGVCYSFKRNSPEFEKCSTCFGAGKVMGKFSNKMEPCKTCGGKGRVKSVKITYSREKLVID